MKSGKKLDSQDQQGSSAKERQAKLRKQRLAIEAEEECNLECECKEPVLNEDLVSRTTVPESTTIIVKGKWFKRHFQQRSKNWFKPPVWEREPDTELTIKHDDKGKLMLPNYRCGECSGLWSNPDVGVKNSLEVKP